MLSIFRVTNLKRFGICVNHFFSNKGVTESEIVVKKDGELVQDISSLVETFNVHYNTIAKSLNLFEWHENYCSQIESSVQRTVYIDIHSILSF